MGRFPKKPGEKGSLRNIQVLVNDYACVLNAHVAQVNPALVNIRWRSPLWRDNLAEYRDGAFLERLNIQDRIKHPLQTFFPNGGPQWDALGLAGDNSVLLVEAKANLPELRSPGSTAGPDSLSRIRQSLQEVRDYLGVTDPVDWTKTYYQYTNRLAHLYYLKVKNDIDAYLVQVYFIGDDTVGGPHSKKEWQTAIEQMEAYLGLRKHWLLEHVLDIYINVKEIGL